jgi:hypothetical protein
MADAKRDGLSVIAAFMSYKAAINGVEHNGTAVVVGRMDGLK